MVAGLVPVRAHTHTHTHILGEVVALSAAIGFFTSKLLSALPTNAHRAHNRPADL